MTQAHVSSIKRGLFKIKSQVAYQVLKRYPVANHSKVNRFNFFPVSDNPKIALVYTPSGLDHIVDLAGTNQVKAPCHFLIFFNWYVNPVQILNFRDQVRGIRQLNSKFTVHALCNSELEYRNFKWLVPEVPSHFINQNIVLDENIYTLTNKTGKRFGAVINARMLPFKRLELAAGIKDLAVITCGWNNSDPVYRSQVQSTLSHAEWANLTEGGVYRKLSAEEISRELNLKKVGLVFSKREGACFAATEYMLCGLPVVSTASLGGRDVFFTEQNSRIASGDVDAIASAVEELSTSSPSPTEVRNSAMAVIGEHRQRFFELVNSISASCGVKRSFESEWTAIHRNKAMNFTAPSHFIDFLQC